MKRFWLLLVALIVLIVPVVHAQPIYFDEGRGHVYQAIRPGDTLTRVAKDHIPEMIAQLREANPHVVGDRIYAGKFLQLPDVWFASGASTIPAPSTTPTKKEINMNDLLTQILLWTVLIGIALGILYLIGRGLGIFHSHPHHHYYRPGCYPCYMPPVTVAPITVSPIHVTVDHAFPAGGVPVAVTMTTPPTPTTTIVTP